jgi:4-carboxymuconolactone decarboxylase
MAKVRYSSPAQVSEFMRQSGLPKNTPQSNAFRMFAHAPSVGAATLRLVLALLTETTLDPKLRELVILRVSQRCEGEYAWVQHAAIAKTVGVSDAQIAALERGEIALDLFAVRERVTFAFADKLVDRAFVTEDTFAAMQRMFSPRELLELLLLIGYFRMICGVMTTMGVEVEPPFGGKVLELVRDTAAKATHAPKSKEYRRKRGHDDRVLPCSAH